MNALKKILLTTALLPSLTLFAADFRIGPKIGLGIGTPLGLKEGDGKAGVGFPIGAVGQFDFGSFGIDIGLNYRYSIFGTDDEANLDSDAVEDDVTTAIGFSSIELPVTAYYKLNRSKGFFKFGGGLGLDYGVGKIKVARDVEYTDGSPDLDVSANESFDKFGFSQYDVYVIAHFGYQFLFESWAMSVDFQPKYGIVNRVKDNSKFSLGNAGTASNDWHTLMFDLSATFLF